MNVPIEQECATKLLDESLPIAQRAQLVSEFFSQRMASVPVTSGNHRLLFRGVVTSLITSVPAEQRPALERVLRETTRIAAAELNQKSRQTARQLRSIAPGTPIIVRDHSGEKSVVFRAMRRTRFVFEYPDGERYSASLNCFVSVDAERRLDQCADSADVQSPWNRAHCGTDQDVVKPISRRNPQAIRDFLDYVAANPRNRNSNPAQFSVDATLDFDLSEVIHHGIRAVGAADDLDWVREQVLQYPDAAVRGFVLKVLELEPTI